MKLTSEQIDFFQKANKILQTPSHFPDGNKVMEEYMKIYKEEYEQKKAPYYRSLSPSCGSCIRHMVYTVANDMRALGLIDLKGDFIK